MYKYDACDERLVLTSSYWPTVDWGESVMTSCGGNGGGVRWAYPVEHHNGETILASLMPHFRK